MSAQLRSERVVLSSPMSFHGSAARIWKITKQTENNIARAVLIFLALLLILFVWMAVIVWYVVFGLLLVPYRLTRRGQRKRKMENLRHRELLEAVHNKSQA
jgi:Flp pilus assembly protein TadB